MAPLTEAEKLTHEGQHGTTKAIIGTGIATAVVTLLTPLWTVCSTLQSRKADKERRVRADKEDRKRRDGAKKDLQAVIDTLRQDHEKLRQEFDAKKLEAESLLDIERREHRIEIMKYRVELRLVRNRNQELQDQLRQQSEAQGPSSSASTGG